VARPLEVLAEEVAAGEVAAQPSEAPAVAVARLSAAQAAAVVRPLALQAAVAARPSAAAWPSLPFPSRSVGPPRSVRTAHALRWRRIASQSEWSWQAALGVVFSWQSRSRSQVSKSAAINKHALGRIVAGFKGKLCIYFAERNAPAELYS
jgi:hypothetical protein